MTAKVNLLEHMIFRDNWLQIDALGIWRTKVIVEAD